jgi:osmotically-inducible protein OsmY
MKYPYIGILSAVVLLSGCDPVSLAVGTGATIGVASEQEGGVRGAITDNAIQLKIADLYIKKDFTMFRKLNVTVKEGRVLLTGSVPNPDMRVEAVRLAWQADGVRQVLNEVTVDDGSGIKGAVVDGWVTSNIKAKLMFDKYVQSINYNIDTVNGNVYVMGVAQNKKELERVMDYARNAGHVHNVVSYVRLKYEDPDNAAGMTPDNG